MSTAIPEPFTPVPNVLLDFVFPLLGQAEAACLLYIVRRTTGFRGEDGERKRWDRIAISQFEGGITTGDYVLDLGCGVKRPGIIRALRALEHKGIVDVTSACARCMWNDDGAETDEVIDKCPRCRRQADRRYGLAPLDPERIAALLCEIDPQGRTWEHDPGTGHLRARTPEATSAGADGADEDPVELWYPDLADQAALQLAEGRGGKALSPALRRKHVDLPIAELQEMAKDRPMALRYALEQTISKRIAAQGRKVGASVRANYGWSRYARAIVQKELQRPVQGRGGAPERPSALGRVRALLAEARDLNRSGEHERAAALLAPARALAAELAAETATDAARIEGLIITAYDKGLDDPRAAERATSPYAFLARAPGAVANTPARGGMDGRG